MKKICLLAIAISALVFNVNAQSFQGFNSDGTIDGVKVEEAFDGGNVVLKLAVPSDAMDAWNAQLVTPRFEGLDGQVEGASFDFSFDYKGSVGDGYIRIASGKTYPFDYNWSQGENSQIVNNEGFNAVYGPDHLVSTEWQNLSYRYFIGPDGADSIRLEIDCGRAVGDVFFKNFVLKIGGKVVAEYYKVSEYETVEISGITYYLYKDGTVIVGSAQNGLSDDVAIADYITKDGKKYPVSAIASGAFSYCIGITSVNIPNTVCSIGSQAFYGCSGLKSVIIPSSVTSIVDNAFEACDNIETLTYNTNALGCVFSENKSLVTVNIGNSVTKIADLAFWGCGHLKNVAISESVKSIGDAAFYGVELPTLSVPKSVSAIGRDAFYGVGNLQYSGTAIDVYGNYWGALFINGVVEGDFLFADASKNRIVKYLGQGGNVVIPNSVVSIGDAAFEYCYELKSVVFPNTLKGVSASAFNFTGLQGKLVLPNSLETIEENAFSGCFDLDTVIIPNSVVSVGEGAFSNCSNLCYAKCSDSMTSIVTAMFDGCSGLSSVVFPSELKGISSTAFFGCFMWSDVAIEIPNTVDSIGAYAFSGCSGLTLSVPSSVKSIGEQAFYDVYRVTYHGSATFNDWDYGWGARFYNVVSDDNFIYDSTKTKILLYVGDGGEVVIPESVTSIEKSAFSGCDKITSVVIPNSVTSIGEFAFSLCSGLTLSVPSSVNSIGYQAFYDVYIVTYHGSATFDESNYGWGARFYNVVSDDNFIYDSTMTKVLLYIGDGGDVVIPNSVTTIGESSIRECNNLKSVVIPNSVTSIDRYAFYGCPALKSIVIPNSVKSIGENAFAYCSGLESAILSDSLSVINVGLFSGCSGLTSIVIPNSVTSIMDYAFADCSSLISVELPNSIDSIANGVFSSCGKLTSINIPESVTFIGQYAFVGCRSLSFIVIPNSVTTIDEFVFQGCDNLTINCDFVSQPQGWSIDWNPDNRPVVWKTDAITDGSASEVAIYAYSNVIVVENANDDILVYDVMGRLVARSYDSHREFTMARGGIYIVKVGNKAEHVVVE